MPIKPVISFLALVLACPYLHAQQTGVAIGRTPGSAVSSGFPRAARVPLPKPTCDSPAGQRPNAADAPQLPDMEFSRMDLLCVRHPDGRFEELPKHSPGLVSPDGKDAAYWVKEKHELHLRSLVDGADSLLDVFPGVTPEKMFWSAKDRALVYALNATNPVRYCVLDLDSMKRHIVEQGMSRIVGVPDPGHLLVIAQNSVERINVADGKREVLAAVPYADDATYSQSGALLGIRVVGPGEGRATDDDTPDCTGGTFALVVQNTSTKRLFEIPFPEKFDSVLDYAFSPDDSAIAITYGTEACDYPGEVARIYVVSLPNLTMTPISPADRLSVEAHWSPDGRTIIYSDYSSSGPPLIAVDVRSGKTATLTNPGQNGPDLWLAWR
jgi:hypothetical protein